MSRPSIELTPDLIEQVTTYVAHGAYPEVAAEAAAV